MLKDQQTRSFHTGKLWITLLIYLVVSIMQVFIQYNTKVITHYRNAKTELTAAMVSHEEGLARAQRYWQIEEQTVPEYLQMIALVLEEPSAQKMPLRTLANKWGFGQLHIVDKTGRIIDGYGGNLSELSPQQLQQVLDGELIILDEWSYGAIRLSENRWLLGVHNISFLLGKMNEQTSPAHWLSDIYIGANGFVCAVDRETETIIYTRDDDMTGKTLSQLNATWFELSDQRFALLRTANDWYLCLRDERDPRYIFTALVSLSEAASGVALSVILTEIIFLAVSVLVSFHHYNMRRDVSRGQEEKSKMGYMALRSRYLNLTLHRRLRPLVVGGSVVLAILLLYSQMLARFDRQRILGTIRLDVGHSAIHRSLEYQEEIQDFTEQLAVKKASLTAWMVRQYPTLMTPEKLQELAYRMHMHTIEVRTDTGELLCSNYSDPDGLYAGMFSDAAHHAWEVGSDLRSHHVYTHTVAQGDSDYEITNVIVSGETPNTIICLGVRSDQLNSWQQIADVSSLLKTIYIENNGVLMLVHDDESVTMFGDDLDVEKKLTLEDFPPNVFRDGYVDILNFHGRQYLTLTRKCTYMWMVAAIPMDGIMRTSLSITMQTTLLGVLALMLLSFVQCVAQEPGKDLFEPGQIEKASTGRKRSYVRLEFEKDQLVGQTTGDRNDRTRRDRWNIMNASQRLRVYIGSVLYAVEAGVLLMALSEQMSGNTDTLASFLLGRSWESTFNIFAITYVFLMAIIFMLMEKGLLTLLKICTNRRDINSRENFFVLSRIVRVVGLCALVLVALQCFGVDPATLIASAGVVSVIVAFGTQNIVSDLLSGAFLLCDDDFNVGDWVRIGYFEGQVTQIGFRTTRLTDKNGVVTVIRNSTITSVIRKPDAETEMPPPAPQKPPV